MMSTSALKILRIPNSFMKDVHMQGLRHHVRSKHSAKTTALHYDKEPYQQNYVSLNSQSFLLPGPDRARATKLLSDPNKFVHDVPGASVQTVYDVLDHGLKTSKNGDCVGSRSSVTGEYEWLSYSDVILKSQCIGSAFVHLGMKPSNETHIGVFAANRKEFLLTLYACAGYSMVLVPLYISLGEEAVMFIIKQVNFSIVIANSNKNAWNVLQNASAAPNLKNVVIIDKPEKETIKAAQEANISLLTFDELEDLGKHNRHDLVFPKQDDLFCIPYTSGTTGIPKGVLLTHRNVISCLSSLVIGYGEGGLFGGTIMSYLPPAHIYEIMNEVASLYFARRVAFYGGDIKKIFEEACFLKPTIFPLVPRLMNFIYNDAMEKVKDHPLKSFLLKLALSRKSKLIQKGVISNSTIWDKLVFKKFQEAMGGQVHMIITTSAPISPDIMRFFRCAAGCYIYEAYGQTEVLAGTMTHPHEHDGGFVGSPLPCNHIKLVDAPEMGYLAKDDAGEICFKGCNVFQGYFKNEEATRDCIDSDGWHHSGDIGKWLPNGCLKIIDRKKHLFKLSQGEYIAPEKVENAYIHAKEVLQIYIDGLSNEDYVVVLVVPELNNFRNWAKSKGFKTDNFIDLLKNKEVRKEFLRKLHKHGKKEDLNPLEQAKNLSFLTEAFSVENDLLTPTLKVKRNKARKKYDQLLQQLYAEGPLACTDLDFRKRRNLVHPTKKINCPVAFSLTRVLALPGFKVCQVTKWI